jgi:threonine/homoserine/homoserine lactone efflux protein
MLEVTSARHEEVCMGEAIGAILPLAIGVAISPIPIIAAILMLLSPRAGTNGVGFLIGWVLGIVVATVIFVVVASVSDLGGSENPSTAASWIKIVLGGLLILLAGKQWKSRPKQGEAPALPSWMQAIDKVTPAKSLGVGFLLAAVNPKNLAMCIGAGIEIGGADLPTSDVVVATAVFSVLAASSVAIPVIGYLVASNRLRGPLNELRDWLLLNNAAVMTVLLLVIGTVLIGKGVSGLG